MKPTHLYLGFGSNLGERGENIRAAARQLSERGIPVHQMSRLYETAPVGDTHQPWFLNSVGEASAGLTPEQVLEVLMEVEFDLGRDRTSSDFRPGGPRCIDLDLLFYGDLQVRQEGLSVPHPRLHERRFVLAPLAEIAPDLIHPVFHRSIRDLLGECGDTSEIHLHGESPTVEHPPGHRI